MTMMQRTSSTETTDSFLQLLDLLMPEEDDSPASQLEFQPATSIVYTESAGVDSTFQEYLPSMAVLEEVQHPGSIDTQQPRKTSRQLSGCKTSLAQRQSHQRLRSRKKNKMLSLEEDLQRKMAQLALLQLDNDKLKAKVHTLETAVASTELTLATAQHLQPSPSTSHPPSCTAGSIQQASIDLCPSLLCPSSEAAGAACSSSIHPQTAESQPQPVQPPAALPRLPELIVKVLARLGPNKPEVTADGLRSTHRAAINQLAQLLLAHDAASPEERTPVVQQMVACFSDLIAAVIPFGLWNHGQAYQLRSTNMETGDLEAPPPGHWDRLVQQLQLSPAELHQLAAMHEVFEPKAQKVVQQRAQLAEQLGAASAGMAAPLLQQAYSQAASDAMATASQLLAVQAAGLLPPHADSSLHGSEAGVGLWAALLQQGGGVVPTPAADPGISTQQQHRHQAPQQYSPHQSSDLSELVRKLERSLRSEFLLDSLLGMVIIQMLPWHKVCRLAVHCWPYAPHGRHVLLAAAQQYAAEQGARQE